MSRNTRPYSSARSAAVSIMVAVCVCAATFTPTCVLAQAVPGEAMDLNRQALQLCRLGRYAEAIPLEQRAVRIIKDALGEENAYYATGLNNLADMYSKTYQYAQAESLYLKVMEIRKAVLPETHLDYAASLNNLAELYRETGRYAEAEPLYLKVIEVDHKADPDEKSPLYVTALNNLSLLYREMALYSKALPLAQRVVEIMKKSPGEEHPLYATGLANLAALHTKMGQYAEAERLLSRSIEIFQRALIKERPDQGVDLYYYYAAGLNNFGELYYETGRYDRAEQIFLQAEEVVRRNLGEENLSYVASLNDLAVLYTKTGRYDKAEPYHVKATELLKRILGGTHPDYAVGLNNLAEFYRETGRYDKAEPLYRQAMEIIRVALGKEHRYAATLTNLAELYHSTGQYDKAEPLYKEATEIFRVVVREAHPDYATSLTNLATLYHATGRYDKAEPLYVSAAQIYKKIFGEAHPDYATSLNNLAELYRETGQYAKAELLYLRVIEIYRKALGEEHPLYVIGLKNLAALYAATGRTDQAFATLSRGMSIEQRNLGRVFDVSSEQEMRAYLSTVSESLDGLISMTASKKPNDTGAVESGLSWTLRRKAVILDTLVRFRQAQLLAESDPAVAERAARLRYLRQQISNLPLNRPSGMCDAELEQEMERLREEGDSLEAELNRMLSDQRQRQATNEVSVEAVRRRLPADAALVEFVRVNVYDFHAAGHQPRSEPARYFAFVLSADAGKPARMVDLGEAAKIDEAIRAVRSQIIQFGKDCRAGLIESATGPSNLRAIKSERDAEGGGSKNGPTGYRGVSNKLYELVFAPVRKELGRATTIYLSPDDQLNLVPFEALFDSAGAGGKYLVESYRFCYLSSGRDLLRQPTSQQGKGTVVFADPDYDMGAVARERKAKDKNLLAKLLQPDVSSGALIARAPGQPATFNKSVLSEKVVNQTRGQNRSGEWQPLKEALLEAQDVEQELRGTGFGPVSIYTKDEALEELFKRVRSPRVLHVSTHGFFPEESGEREESEGRRVDPGTGSAAAVGRMLLERTDDPLLQSGLILSGANRIREQRAAGVDDGWVTAEEISQMQLQGTELVVLSACGSGLGVTSAGEGVYGLKRAFQNAGARAVISTLFEVPDAESRDLMKSFYEGLKSGKSEMDALRQAQLEVIRKRRGLQGAAHPFFWAGYTLTGGLN